MIRTKEGRKRDAKEPAYGNTDGGALQQVDAGRTAADVGREMGVSAATIYAWKAKYGGMNVSETQEAKQLRDENARLKRCWPT